MSCKLKPLMVFVAAMLSTSLATGSKTDLQPKATAAALEKTQIEVLADEYLAAAFKRYPERTTFLGLEDAYNERLYDNSLSAVAKWRVEEDTFLARLKGLQAPDEVGSRDWITYGILLETLEASVATRSCKEELWQASTETNWHRSLPFVFEVQPVATAEDRQQAISRLRQVDNYLDTEITNLKTGLEAGYSAPRVTVIKVPQQIRSLLQEDSIFLSPASRSDNAIFKTQVRKIYDDEIAPAVARYADFIEEEYLPSARETLSVTAHPKGEECYPALTRSFTTMNMSADSIHQIGLEQVATIREEMQRVLDAHFGGGDLKQFIRKINTDPRFAFKTESEVLNHTVSALDSTKAAMPAAFGRLPSANVEIRPYPDFAQSGIGEYRPPSQDGSRPGIFFIAVTEPKTRPRAEAMATLFHETYPGHHLQIAVALELGDQVHRVAKYFSNSGFIEGWALYSETVADELDLYEQPIDYFGLLSSQGARAARLVVDTGLHTKNWTRQQAIDYMMLNTTWAEVDIENDVDRYISWPGQALAYKIGELKIRELRQRAEQKLGPRFDLRAFHDQLLANGALPLSVLEAEIDRWIETESSVTEPSGNESSEIQPTKR